MTPEQLKFMRELARWDGIASPHDLGPQMHQKDNNARKAAKRQGLVKFEGGYWRMTDAGRAALAGASQ